MLIEEGGDTLCDVVNSTHRLNFPRPGGPLPRAISALVGALATCAECGRP